MTDAPCGSTGAPSSPGAAAATGVAPVLLRALDVDPDRWLLLPPPDCRCREDDDELGRTV